MARNLGPPTASPSIGIAREKLDPTPNIYVAMRHRVPKVANAQIIFSRDKPGALVAEHIARANSGRRQQPPRLTLQVLHLRNVAIRNHTLTAHCERGWMDARSMKMLSMPDIREHIGKILDHRRLFRTRRSTTGVLAMIGAIGIGVAAFAGCSIDPNQPELVAIGTASTGSGGYNYGVGISRAINGAQDEIRTSVQSTAGFGENLVLIHQGDIKFGLSQGDVLVSGFSGTGPFAEVGPMKDLRWVAGVALPVWHCFVRADRPITKLADVRGMRFNLGPRQTSTRAINEMLFEAAGIGLDEIEVFELPTSTVFDAVQNSVVSGSCNGFPVGYSSLASLTNFKQIKLIPIESQVVGKMRQRSLAPIVSTQIPARTYAGTDRAIPSFSGVVVLTTSAATSDESVYAITQALWSSLPELQRQAQFSALVLNTETALGGGNIPVHAGALKYYREQGLD